MAALQVQGGELPPELGEQIKQIVSQAVSEDELDAAGPASPQGWQFQVLVPASSRNLEQAQLSQQRRRVVCSFNLRAR